MSDKERCRKCGRPAYWGIVSHYLKGDWRQVVKAESALDALCEIHRDRILEWILEREEIYTCFLCGELILDGDPHTDTETGEDVHENCCRNCHPSENI